ncbi:penicillin-binding protein 2, partial [candidate division WWE3 bacterium]|nr:penicillin-binding protein 2 [candidate division WWE3 bacterium]
MKGITQLFNRKKIHKTSQLERATSWQAGIMAPSDPLSKPDTFSVSIGKLSFVVLGVLLCFGVLSYQIFKLQVIEGRMHGVLADTNRIIVRLLPYERGMIFDRNGVALAKNRPTFQATMVFSQIPTVEEETFPDWQKKVQSLFDLDETEFFDVIADAQSKPFVETFITSGISQEIYIKYESISNDLPGVYLHPDYTRDYPFGPEIAHIIGYTGEINQTELAQIENSNYSVGEQIGRSGIEQYYQNLLRGEFGRETIEVDSVGKSVRSVSHTDSSPGASLFLSLDLELQKKSNELLQSAITEYEATSGVIVVQDAKTSKILALSSLPSYDNNLFAKGIEQKEYQALITDEGKPLFNRAIAGIYPPGSTVKPFVGLAALEEHIIGPNTILTDTPQVIEVGGGRFPDWRVIWGYGPLGNITVKDAIAHSSNIFFYKVSGGYEDIEGLGIKRIKEYLQSFNIGSKTGIDLPGENAGVFPDPAWKLANKNEGWYLGDDYQVGIGQGDLLVTPLQMVNAVTALVNNGRVYRPQLIDKITDQNGNKIEEFLPEVIRELDYSQEYMDTVKQGMRQGVASGIVYPLRNAKVPVAAKTGTAEFG